MSKFPKIKISFFFYGNEFNINDVTKKMNIIPTETRSKEDCPIEELVHTVWVLETKKESCRAVSVQFEKIMNLLDNKEEIIKEICKDYKIETGFLISIFMKNGDNPEVVFTKENMSFIASLNAEARIELYEG